MYWTIFVSWHFVSYHSYKIKPSSCMYNSIYRNRKMNFQISYFTPVNSRQKFTLKLCKIVSYINIHTLGNSTIFTFNPWKLCMLFLRYTCQKFHILSSNSPLPTSCHVLFFFWDSQKHCLIILSQQAKQIAATSQSCIKYYLVQDSRFRIQD